MADYLALGYLLLHFIVLFFNTNYLWGIDSWSYYPFYFSIPLLVISSILIFPRMVDKLTLGISKNFTELSKINIIIILVIAGIGFFLLRENYYYLGDGYLRIRNLEAGYKIAAAEPLDTFIHYLLYKLLNPLIKINGADIYAFSSIAAGMVSIFGIYHYSTRLFQSRYKWLIFAAIVFSSASVQLFFGYVESYSILNMLVILFSISSVYMLNSGKSIIAPSVFFSLAIITHPTGLLMGPAFIFCYARLIWEGCGQQGKLKMILPLLIPLLVISILVVISSVEGFPPDRLITDLLQNSHILPVFTSKDIYGIFSADHFIDFLNLLALIAPALILIPFLKYDITILKDSSVIFLFINFSIYMLYALLFRSDLGLARDWDLFAIAGFQSSILIAYLVLKHGSADYQRALTLILILTLLHTLPWIILNSTAEAALNRAKRLATTVFWSNHARSLLYKEISYIHGQKDEADSAIYYAEKAYQFEKNEKYLYYLAGMNFKYGDTLTALDQFIELSGKNFQPQVVNSMIADIYMQMNEYPNALKYLDKAALADSGLFHVRYNMGVAYLQTSDTSKALLAFLRAGKILDDNTDVLNNLGVIYSQSGNDSMAVVVYNKLIQLDSGKTVNYYNLALTYALSGKNDSSLAVLDRARKLGLKSKLLNDLESGLKFRRN